MVLSFLKIVRCIIRDALAPSHCASCNVLLDDHRVFCHECIQKIQHVGPVDLVITDKKRVPIYAYGAYADPLKKLINAKKFSQRSTSAQLGHLVSCYASALQRPIDCVVPIPLHWTRYAWRGYNQADEIARAVSSVRNVPVFHALVRLRKTAFQAECSRAERALNVLGAFELSESYREKIRGKHIALIDDVFTTGATIEAAARSLYKAQPASVCALVAARTITLKG